MNKQIDMKNLVELKVINNRSNLLKIEKDWNQLFIQQEQQWPFLEWEWFNIFWAEMDLSGWDVFILTAWEIDTLVGAAPLMKKEKRFFGLKYSIISGLENVHSPSYSWLLPKESDKKHSVVKLFIKHISGITTNRYMLTWKNAYSYHSATKDLKRILYSEGLKVDSLPLRFPLTFSIPRDKKSILYSVSKSMRKRLRNKWKRLNNMGKVVFEEVSGSPDLSDYLNSAWELELKTWKGKSGSAIAQDVFLKNFYNNLAIKLSSSGKLALFMLWSDSELVAFLYGICDKQIIHELKGSYNPEFSDYSPGHLLDWKVMEWTQNRGLRKVNMCGEAEDYKKHWCNKQDEVSAIRVFSPELFGKLFYHICFGWKNKLRKIGIIYGIIEFFNKKRRRLTKKSI